MSDTVKTTEIEVLSPKEEALEKAKAKLTARELYAYNVFCGSKTPTISPSTAGKMFELYLQGKSCEEIRKTMPGFGLGQIVHARVHENWDVLVEEHRKRLLESIASRVQQTQLEAVDYVADLIGALHKRDREKIHKFFISGDEKDLEGVGISQSYKQAIELLLKLTGQDVKRVKGDFQHTHVTPPAANKPPTQEEAANVLDALAAKKT